MIAPDQTGWSGPYISGRSRLRCAPVTTRSGLRFGAQWLRGGYARETWPELTVVRVQAHRSSAVVPIASTAAGGVVEAVPVFKQIGFGVDVLSRGIRSGVRRAEPRSGSGDTGSRPSNKVDSRPPRDGSRRYGSMPYQVIAARKVALKPRTPWNESRQKTQEQICLLD